MKKLYFVLFVLLISSQLSATTYTSTQNGSWTNPTTWSPVGVPIPGDDVVINHDVILNTDFAYTTGSISIGVLGTLVQDATLRDLWLNGVNATLNNDGVFTIDNLLLSIGSCSNTGDFNVRVLANFITLNNSTLGTVAGLDSMYNDGAINNNGTFNISAFTNDGTIDNYGVISGLTTVVDSMLNNGVFTNHTNALLEADSCTNTMTFTNDGVIVFNQFTNTGTFINNNNLLFDDFTNTLSFTNKDTLLGSGSMINTGDFDNQSGSYFSLGVSLLNADAVNLDANFNNDGEMVLGDSFFNFDTITGGATGRFTVVDSSVNYTDGYMIGSFDFCDLTPPSTPIKIDYNLGAVDANITYCAAVGVAETLNTRTIAVYPNPTTGVLTVAIDKYETIEIYNVLGEQLVNTHLKVVDMTSYNNGLYILQVKNEQGEIVYQSKVVKH